MINSETGSLAIFCLEGGSRCEDVLSDITLLDKIFKVLREGPTLGSLVSLPVMERVVVLLSEMSGVMLLCFRMLHLGLTLDGFKDVLDRELQRGEAVIHPVGSEWALLRVQELPLLQNALSATLIVKERSQCCNFSFALMSPRLNDRSAKILSLPPTGCTIRLGTGPHSKG